MPACFGLALFAPADAAEIKVLTAGAFKQVVVALVPDFEKQTGHKVTLDNGTAGQLKKRIEGGEAFDVAVITPAVVDELIGKGKIGAGSRVNLASVGVGVVVKEGAPKPDISTVDKFKQALLAAKSVAYIDPASGGSSGVYIDKLLVKLGVAEAGQAEGQAQEEAATSADLIVSGEAELVPAPDQRNRARQGRRPGRAAAGGDPEHHHLCGCDFPPPQKNNAAAKALIKTVLRPARPRQCSKAKGMEPAG